MAMNILGRPDVAGFARAVALSVPLTEEESYAYMRSVLELPNADIRLSQLAVLLSGIGAHCQQVGTVAGVVRGVLDYAGWQDHSDILDQTVLGLAGSGKKGVSSGNISTAAAFISSAAGCRIVKNVSSAASSIAGSADTLDRLGIHVCPSSACAQAHTASHGLAFLRIESQIERFDSVYGGNFIAPHVLSLSLPAMILPNWVSHIAYGLAHPNVATSAQALAKLRPRKQISVFSSSDPSETVWIDEVFGGRVLTSTAYNASSEGPISITNRSMSISPSVDVRELAVDPSLDRTALLRELICGTGPHHVQRSVLDTAAVFLVAGSICDTIDEATQLVAETVHSGRSFSLLRNMLAVTCVR